MKVLRDAGAKTIVKTKKLLSIHKMAGMLMPRFETPIAMHKIPHKKPSEVDFKETEI